MMRRRFRLPVLLGMLLLIGCIAGAAIRPAFAYFTTYSKAQGGYALHLADQTTITEKFSQGIKSVTIANNGGQAVYVRVRAFSGSAYPLTYPTTDGWTQRADVDGDLWWYSDAPVAAGSTAPVLDIMINDIPETAQEGDSFNVIVVYESTPALYDAAGNVYADWTRILDVVTEGGGN